MDKTSLTDITDRLNKNKRYKSYKETDEHLTCFSAPWAFRDTLLSFNPILLPIWQSSSKRRNWSLSKLEALGATDLPTGSSHEVPSDVLLAWCRWMSQRMVAW
jgi:hypothetical protein